MIHTFDWSDISREDLVTFAFACLGFLIALGGVIASSIIAAVCGLALLAVALMYFWLAPEWAD